MLGDNDDEARGAVRRPLLLGEEGLVLLTEDEVGAKYDGTGEVVPLTPEESCFILALDEAVGCK